MCKTTKYGLLLLLLLPLVATAAECPQVPLHVERLADLNIPRIGHQVFCTGGEVVVAGGHTAGFVPTPTAEYYRDGAWHLIDMIYSHDQGGMMQTADGEILLFGGHEKELGIGQTFTIERYDPASHSFKGYGCMEKKRCFANTLPMDSGCVIISGNWFQDDCIELYDGSRQNKFVKPVSQHRSLPHILRTAPDNAIIFAARDIHANDFDAIIVDRLKGDPFSVPLFETWRPYCYPIGYHGSCFIGDDSKDEYINLIQVMQGDTVMAVARAEGEKFSLLPTVSPIPMQSQWGPITWYCHILADRKVSRAYIVGYGEDEDDHRIYVAAIDYQKTPAPITLYYSEPQEGIGRVQPVLTNDGDLMMAGGVMEHNNNYDASAAVYLLHVSTEASYPIQASNTNWWLWFVLSSLVLAGIMVVIFVLYRKKYTLPTVNELNVDKDTTAIGNAELMEQICHYMDEQQPYLDSNLKVQDVADALGTNRTYISVCINSQKGCSFNQFVNSYRIDHAKRLLRQYPDKKISEVGTASGFSTEVSFFRTFKTITGVSPSEWRENQQ